MLFPYGALVLVLDGAQGHAEISEKPAGSAPVELAHRLHLAA